MRQTLIIALAVVAGACGNSAPVVQNTTPVNTSGTPLDRPQTVTAHTTENQPPAAIGSNSNTTSAPTAKWSASGEPIDTAKFDGTIAAGEKIVKAKPADAEAKKNLAQAYFDRGMALTDARQYAAALGDYRRALKLDPEHQESRDWINQIVGIYQMLKKEPPKEGEEPAPLPFKKD